MAQIIRHRKGVLESVVSATKRKAELLIVTGSSGITSTNSDAMIFFGDGTDATPSNKMLYGTATPNLTGASYSTAVDGIPYYNTTEGKLYILAKGGNIEISSNTDGTGIYSGSAQVLADFLSDNANVNVGSGDFTTTGSGSFGDINVSGNATIDGNIILGGNINIGDANTDTVSFGGEISSDFIPSATNTYDLGSATDKFAEVHATTLFGAINATNGVVSGSIQVVGILDELNSYTASNDTDQSAQDARLSALEVETGSIDTDQSAQNARLSALEVETGSIDTAQTAQDARLSALETETGSIETEQSAQDTRLDQFATETGSIDTAQNAQDDRLDQLSTATGSISTEQSAQDGRLSNLESTTASIDTAQTAQDGRLSNIESFTSSIDTTIKSKLDADTVISGSSQVIIGDVDGFTAYSSSVDARTVALEDAVGEGSSLDLRLDSLETFSGSQEGKDSTLEAYTASVDVSLSEINSYTSSLKTAISVSGQNVTVAGNLEVQGTTTTVDSTTVNIGDNIIELNGSGAVLGGMYVGDVTSPGLSSGSLLWDGTNNYWIAGASGSESKVLLADGDDVVSGSAQVVDMLDELNAYTASNDTDQTAQDARLSALEVETGSIDTAQSLQNSRLDLIETATGSLETEQSAQGGRLNNLESTTASLVTEQSTQNDRLDQLSTETGSIDTAQNAQDSRLDQLSTETGSIDTAQTAQDARLSALEVETGSIDTAQTAQDGRLSNLESTTASIDTAQTAQDGRLSEIETFTASLDTTFEEKSSASHTLVSGSSQVTSGAASGEVLYKNAGDNTIDGSAIYSDGTDLISIGTATGNVGDLASGNQLSLYGSSISGLLSFDISGTSKSFDYVSSDFRYVDTNSGVGIVLKPNADANKAWIIDTDGDLVSNSNNASVTGSIYGANVVARGDLSGSNLLLTGNANIDGNIVIGGNITIGDAGTDSLTINADIESDIRPNADNTYDLGASGLRYAEIHGTTIFGAINATNGVISGSAQLLNVATDFGTGRVSGEDIGDLAGTSTFTGSFVGDGSGITGLSTTISVSGSDGSNDTVSLLDGAITFDGGTGVSTAVATDTVTISVQDSSTSAKGIASFSSDDFSVSSGDVTLKAGNGVDSSGGVRGANLNADTAGDGLTYSLSNQQLDVDYGSTANTAVEGNTTATFTGTANEITVSDSSAQALGGGIAVTISLPDDVTIGNDLTVTTDASVGGNLSVTGNLSVLGTTTTIDSTTVNIGDNVLELNYGGAQDTAGLLVTDTTSPTTASGSLLWDGTNDYWKAGALGSEKEIALLNAAPTTNTVLKADSNGLLVDSVLTDDGTDATFSGDVIVSGLSVGSNGGFLYVDTSNQLNSATATNAGDVIQWDGSSFVASNELDGGTF